MIAYNELQTAILIIILLVGLVLLCLGGDGLAKGAEHLALNFKINPLVVGLTIVAIATSMPELIIGLMAAAQGNDDLAMGNIIGSNLGNMGLIMGIAAIMSPIVIQRRLLIQEMPMLFAISLVFYVFSTGLGGSEGLLNRFEGMALLVGTVIYLVFIVQSARKEKNGPGIASPDDASDGNEEAPFSNGKCFLFVVLGGVGLASGASLMVGSAEEVATRLGISQTVIGLTIVALGTSLPELAASVAAALRKQGDIIAGNVIGSNVFNMLLIGGGVSTVLPLKVEKKMLLFEYPCMLLMTGLMGLAFYTGRKITRGEGIGLVLLYFIIIVSGYFFRI